MCCSRAKNKSFIKFVCQSKGWSTKRICKEFSIKKWVIGSVEDQCKMQKTNVIEQKTDAERWQIPEQNYRHVTELMCGQEGNMGSSRSRSLTVIYLLALHLREAVMETNTPRPHHSATCIPPLVAYILAHPVQVVRTGLPVRSRVRPKIYLQNTICPVARAESRRHLCSASSVNLIVPVTRRTTMGDRDFAVAALHAWNSLPSQPISGCLQTFTENSLLYSVLLLTLFLITLSSARLDIVKGPWKVVFYLRHFNIDYFTLHYIIANVFSHSVKCFWGASIIS